MDDEVVDTREDKTLTREQAVIQEAKSRFMLVADYESFNRKEAIDDLNMLAGKNHWPADIVAQRKIDKRPVLTINKLPAFTDQVLNDSRLNKISIKIRPYGGGSTKEIAATFNGLIRSIENISDADVAYQTALEGAVNNGFGYVRVTTEFADDSSFDQEIRIRRIRNPMTVYLDHHHVEHDGRDCKWGFITEKISRAEYKARYPKLSPPVPIAGGAAADEGYSHWVMEDLVRVAEYWVKEPVVKRLYLLSDKRVVDGNEWDKVKDDLKAAERMIHLEPNPQDPNGPPIEVDGPAPEGTDYPQTILNPTPEVVRERKVDSHKVMQYFIDGEKIITKTEWLGKYIPIVPVWGKELVIGEERHLRGLIRFAKDPMRMYNYFRTAATETVALAPKAPYIMEERQIEGHEQEWADLNTKNKPYLLYKGVAGIQGAPQRQVITQTAIGEITESNLANDEIKATTSLFDASLGQQGNEVSGRAIFARQREGDIANFTYHDNLRRAIKYVGDILVDLIPKVYDTQRQVMIINEDESDQLVGVNQVVVDAKTGEQVILNDLSQGRYKVIATTGPSFTTQRVEAAQSMMDFIRVAPDAATLMVDLIAENQDWPGSVKIARRFKKAFNLDALDAEGPQQPKQLSLDDMVKQGKAEGIQLGNVLKKLKIVENKRELENTYADVARAGATGALQALGVGGGGDRNEGG